MKLIDKHARKAHESQYDRRVAVAAIGTVREEIQKIPVDLIPQDYADRVIEQLKILMRTYHDPDGEYTSGKGVIGDVSFDVQEFLKNSNVT